MSNSCCPPGSWEKPLNPSGPPETKGTIVTVGDDLPLYYTAPPGKSDKAVVVFPDIWPMTPQIKSICDTLAEKGGYHVVSPDSFRGETADVGPDLKTWASKFPYDTVVAKDIQLTLDYLNTTYQVPKDQVGAMGFCWGGWVIAKSSSEGVFWKVGVSPHPSTKLESFVFEGDEDAMLLKTTLPFLIMPAGNDPEKMRPGSDLVKDLEKKGGKSVPFLNQQHGFTNRGDFSIKEVKEDAEKALTLTLEFIKEHLG